MYGKIEFVGPTDVSYVNFTRALKIAKHEITVYNDFI
jgi:hypothetical protein